MGLREAHYGQQLLREARGGARRADRPLTPMPAQVLPGSVLYARCCCCDDSAAADAPKVVLEQRANFVPPILAILFKKYYERLAKSFLSHLKA